MKMMQNSLIIAVKFLVLVSVINLSCKGNKQRQLSDNPPSLHDADQQSASKNEEQIDLLIGESGLLNQFKLTDDDSITSNNGFIDAIVVIPADEHIPHALKPYVREDGNVLLALRRSQRLSLELSSPSKAITAAVQTGRRIPVKRIPATFATPGFYQRLAEAKQQGLRVPGETSKSATDRFIQRMAEYKKTIPDGVNLDDAFDLWRFRAEIGVLDFNGKLRDLEAENPKIGELYEFNFSKLDDFLINQKLKPADLWEVQQRWPWPSDHLPASSIVELSSGASVKATSMNLLKKGFDDNRLQTSQGLGAQLASRYLKRVEGQKGFVLDFDKPFDLPSIRNDAQMKFINDQLRDGKIDLLGLQEVTEVQVAALKKIGERHNFEVISTRSARETRDVITREIHPELQDHGVIFIDKNKYEILDSPVVSTYGSGEKANKHITSVLLKDKKTGGVFTFTNTHADFGQINDLATHQKNLSSRWTKAQYKGREFEGIIVGDMNAPSDKVLSSLRQASPGNQVLFGDNTPAHVGFSQGKAGQVVAYDTIFAVSPVGKQLKISEDPDIGNKFRQYAEDYRDTMAQAKDSIEAKNP